MLDVKYGQIGHYPPQMYGKVHCNMWCRDRLSASDMLQVRKVIEHLYEKVIGQGSDGGSQTASNTSANASSTHADKTDRDDDLSSIADEKVELLCNDQVPSEE